ncbi:MAG: hypothetical protein NUK57_12345 [Gudongella sp.]|nr:hypothetical protein [Gudongella sp.]
MRTSMAKEWAYATRSGRLVVLLGSFLFLAISTPLMYKYILPMILETQLGQVSSEEIAAMMNMGQRESMESYIGDVFEIGSIVVSFSLCGLLAQEISENNLVIPLCSGKRYGEIIGAKILVFGFILGFVQIISTFATYVYSGVLFSFEIDAGPVIISGILQGIYMIFILSCILMWGAIIKRPIPSGFATLATVYGMHFLGSIFNMEKYIPSGLLIEASKMSSGQTLEVTSTILPTIVLIVAITLSAVARMKGLTWNER